MTTWTDAIPYFARAELACKGTGTILLDARFAAHLPALRAAWGKPLSPTSVCRTPAHNDSVGGHPRSLHLTENPEHPTRGTMAADIAWRDWPAQRKLDFARLAYRMGWSVGLHDGFCHVDLRRMIGLTKAVFVYGAWSAPFARDEVL